MTRVLSRTEDALLLVDEIVASSSSPACPNGPDHVDAIPDLLLAELFDERRGWEIVCEQVGDTLDRAHLHTLARFLA